MTCYGNKEDVILHGTFHFSLNANSSVLSKQIVDAKISYGLEMILSKNEGIIAHGFFCDIMNIFLAYCVVWLKSLFYFDIFT